MPGIKALWWKWIPQDYLAAVTGIDLKHQGAWTRLINHSMMNSQVPGVVTGNLMWLSADWHEAIGDCWEILLSLALLGICDLRVDTGAGFEVVDELWMAGGGSKKNAAAYWKVEVTCRRVKRDAVKREKRMQITADARLRGGNNGASCAYPPGNNGASCAYPPGNNDAKNSHCAGGGSDTMGDCSRAREARSKMQEIPPVSPLPDSTTSGKGGSKRKTGERVSENTELMKRIGSWFGRRPETLWALDEAKKLKAINPQPDEVDVLEWNYTSDHPEVKPYRRHNLETLLNNWTTDTDKARRRFEEYGQGDAKPVPAREPDFAVV